MSQTESHVGTLRPVIKTNEAETTTEVIIRLLGKDTELTDNEDDLFEQLRDIGYNYDKYFLFNGILYEADNKELNGDDICEAVLQNDGTIKYALQFYNGGTCFSEMMNDALETINPKNK